MLSEARDSAERDWDGSEVLLNAIRQIEPGYSIPPELSETILGKRREAEIVLLFQRVEKVESASDWIEAKRLLDAGHGKFPGDANIIERQKAVSDQIRQLEMQRGREDARQDTAGFRMRVQSTGTKRGLAKLQSAYVAKGYVGSQDPEIRALAAALIAEIDSKLHGLEAPKRKQISSTGSVIPGQEPRQVSNGCCTSPFLLPCFLRPQLMFGSSVHLNRFPWTLQLHRQASRSALMVTRVLLRNAIYGFRR